MKRKSLLDQLRSLYHEGNKGYAVLVDPDHYHSKPLQPFISLLKNYPPDMVFVGGSVVSSMDMQQITLQLKQTLDCPIIIFPGGKSQVVEGADGILFLSLISGRNPEYLIGQQVMAAPTVKKFNLDVLPTGYMLIDGGCTTSVGYVSNTVPLPRHDPKLASSTALAGTYLGLQLIYLEAGSGAKQAVPQQLIRRVRDEIDVPLIVGGGIRDATMAKQQWEAGADLIVVGNKLEEDPEFCQALFELKKEYAFQ